MICPECNHEWDPKAAPDPVPIAIGSDREGLVVKDAYGTRLQDGDSVTLIKDLPLKGSSQKIKIGTKVKNIKLVEGDHNIDCRIEGVGAIALKSEFVKKV